MYFCNTPRPARISLRRAIAMLSVALCKMAVLLAMLEASAQALEPANGAEECTKVEMANPLLGGSQRTAQLKPSSAHQARAVLGADRRCRRANRVVAARTDGHRLANGLLAPMNC
jgi:hypothetical protein